MANSVLTSYLATKNKTSSSSSTSSKKSSNSVLSTYLSSKSNTTTSMTLNSGSSNNSVLSTYLNSKNSTTVTEESKSTNNGGILGGIGYTLEKVGLGVLQSLEGIWDYAASGLAKLFGADDWAEEQVATDWVNYNHADEWYNPSSGWQVAGDVASGIGTSIPAIAAVVGATVISGGTLTPTAATLVSSTVAGLSAAGSSLKEAYQETGELGGKEYAYATASGVMEGVIEGFEDIAGFGTGTVIDNIATTFSKNTAGTLAKNSITSTLVKSFVGEAAEEGISSFLTPYIKRLTYDKEAENASWEEIGYSALIGGLSGMVMGGFSSGVTATTNTVRGNTLVEKGQSTNVLETAKNISAYQTENHTDYESYETVSELYTKLQTSLEKTDGEVKTVRQKQLLGQLERANTASVFEPMIQKSAIDIYNNAESVAARYSTLYKDADGNPITITADEIRAGIDTSSEKAFAKSMREALKTNSKLRGIAVIDATGRIAMDTKAFADSTTRGEALFDQTDLNTFVETATDEEMKSVGSVLGVENWETITADELKGKIVEFAQNGGIEEYRTASQTKASLQSSIDSPVENKTNIPYRLNLQQDGTYHYTTQDGVDFGVVKQGDNYYIYDYKGSRLSKALTEQEANKYVQQIRSASQAKATQNVQQQTAPEQAKEQALQRAQQDIQSVQPTARQTAQQTVRQQQTAARLQAQQQTAQQTQQAATQQQVATPQATQTNAQPQAVQQQTAQNAQNGTSTARQALPTANPSATEQAAQNAKQTAQTAAQTQQQTQERATEQTEAQTTEQTDTQERKQEQTKKKTRQEQAKELDDYARENIKGYNALSARNQSAIRALLRQGRLYGIDEKTLLSIARVSAHSGLTIIFSETLTGDADGWVNLKSNRIILNPNAKSRSMEQILIHELTHKIYNSSDGILTVAESLELMTDKEKESIHKRYSDHYKKNGDTLSQLTYMDEINAHLAEKT
ncbi:MAG: hypothetical protein LUD19_06250, partial [Clostridia bacterium]|nr:hypothetical protein [Clostridia bacterium]